MKSAAHKDKDWMTRLAGLTELRQYRPREYGVEELGDALVGVRDGYIVALGPRWESAKAGGGKFIRFFIRFTPTEEKTLTTAMRRCKAMFEGEKLIIEAEWGAQEYEEEEPERPEALRRKERQVESHGEASSDDSESARDSSFTWDWQYYIHRPDPEQVLQLLNTFVNTLKRVAPPLPQTCEICKKISVSELTLRNGTPGYYCDTCQEKEAEKFRRKLREYEHRPVNHQKGLAYGLVSLLVTGVVVGFLAALVLPRVSDGAAAFIVLFGSGLVVAPVGSATQAGLGRFDDRGVKIILVVSLLGMFASHVFYYVFWAWRLTSQPFGLWLVRPALALFVGPPVVHVQSLLGCLHFRYHIAPPCPRIVVHVLSLLGCLFMAFFVAVQGGLRHEFPSPEVTFERLDAKGHD